MEEVQTNNFSFIVTKKIEKLPRGGEGHTYTVGDCLQLYVLTKEAINTFPIESMVNTGKLISIKNIQTCITNEMSEDDFNNKSFSKELVNWAINHVKHNYKHITKITLDDASYIPCDLRTNDILDLYTYNIAHKGETWYEFHFKAKIENPQRWKQYNEEITKYTSKEFKNTYTFDIFFYDTIVNYNEFATNLIKANYSSVKELFETSDTFPIFFEKLKGIYTKKDKCKFYKNWLEVFIKTKVIFEKRWCIYLNHILNGGKKKTRKGNNLKRNS
jgi:hypothetical protein